MESRFRGIVYGLATILILMLASSFILALIVKFTEISSVRLTWTTFIVSVLILMVGGFIGGRMTLHKGWLTGLCIGGIYSLGVILFQFLAHDYWIADRQTMYFLIFLISAMTGSMFGVYVARNRNG